MYLELDGKELGLKFSACHFIPFHEKCGRLHGHNYYVSVRLEGEQGESGMLHDFVELKRLIKDVIEMLDHRVLLAGDSTDSELSIRDEVEVRVGEKRYVFPLDDCAVLDLKIISAEELARFVLAQFMDAVEFPPNISKLSVRVEEGKGQGAWAEAQLR